MEHSHRVTAPHARPATRSSTAFRPPRRKERQIDIEPIDSDGDTGNAVSRAIRRLGPDGIILTPNFSDNPVVLRTIEETGTSLARIAGTIEGYGEIVRVDERPISRTVVRHLLGLGHRRIAIVGPKPEHFVAGGRLLGYHDAMEEAGIAPDHELIVPGDFDFYSGTIAAERLLNLQKPPTAIFASNDVMALGVMSVAQRRGLRIPQDLAVAGFDDTLAGRMFWPPLMSVRQPMDAMAKSAVALLTGQSRPLPALEHQLLVRGSTTGSIEFAASRIETLGY